MPTLEGLARAIEGSNPFRRNRVSDPSSADADETTIHAQEFGRLLGRIEAVRRDDGSAGILVVGQAGVGKSHLLARLFVWSRDNQITSVFLHNVLASPERIARYVLHAMVSALAGNASSYAESSLYGLLNQAIQKALVAEKTSGKKKDRASGHAVSQSRVHRSRRARHPSRARASGADPRALDVRARARGDRRALEKARRLRGGRARAALRRPAAPSRRHVSRGRRGAGARHGRDRLRLLRCAHREPPDRRLQTDAGGPAEQRPLSGVHLRLDASPSARDQARRSCLLSAPEAADVREALGRAPERAPQDLRPHRLDGELGALRRSRAQGTLAAGERDAVRDVPLARRVRHAPRPESERRFRSALERARGRTWRGRARRRLDGAPGHLRRRRRGGRGRKRCRPRRAGAPSARGDRCNRAGDRHRVGRTRRDRSRRVDDPRCHRGRRRQRQDVDAKVVVEEAIRNGVPVLAIDPQGDLVQFLLARPEAEVEPAYRREREEFLRRVEPRIFTPGTSHGIRLSLDPIRVPAPGDLDRIANVERRDEETRTMLEQVAGNLVGLAKAGGDLDTQRTFVYQVLAKIALGLKPGATVTLRDIVAVVRDPEAAGIEEADYIVKKGEREKLGRKLHGLVEGPASSLFTGGVRLDLGALAKPHAPGKIPLNVIYLNALTDDDQKHFFLASLASEIYRWMITSLAAQSGPGARPNLLFYIDEARDFIPAGGRKPPAKEPLIRLFTQGRKYGVACLLCTQSPRSVDYNVFGNASTKLIGRLEAAQDVERVAQWFATSGAAPAWLAGRNGATPGTFVGRWPGIPAELEGREITSRPLFSAHKGA